MSEIPSGIGTAPRPVQHFKYDHVDSIAYAEISPKGIKYGTHEFNAETTIKDPDTGKDKKVTVVRRAEREWMMGLDAAGDYSFVTQHGGMVFSADKAKLDKKAKEIYDFLFGKKNAL